MNVLSLFDGMSCGQMALERSGIKVDNYFASEIDAAAIKITQHNYPNTIQLGSVVDIKGDDLPSIDLIIGGSPCQDISNLNKFKLGLDGEKSGLFYHYYRLKKEKNPKFFFLENVSGNAHAINQISDLMCVRPIKLNSNLVSAQNRNRLYWTNIRINTVPINKRILLKDILDIDIDEKYFLKEGRLKWLLSEKGWKTQQRRFASINPRKAMCLTKRGEPSWNCNYIKTDDGRIRTLTPIEYERLQTVPDNYTAVVDDKYRYEVCGNGWTVDIVSHIFNGLNLPPIHIREYIEKKKTTQQHLF